MTLHLVQMDLDVERLWRVFGTRLPATADADLGYPVHCALTGLFGIDSPRSFATLEPLGRRLRVLAYSKLDSKALEALARLHASPELYSLCSWDKMFSKPMPDAWRAGMRIGFEVRICPVVRKSAEGPKHQKGAEVDAFVQQCWHVDEGAPVDREAVYIAWMKARLEGASELESTGMRRFALARLYRRRQGQNRTGSVLTRPDATLRGVMSVADPAVFGRVLANGIGRHRAFGFGMLLLSSPPC